MFFSESLLTREGPLAQVWLAANLERKLSKQQFLQSSITQSTQAIVQATTATGESEALALRLSGQLLYGVVRIYSRKAKYLLDDVSDALLKIKSAFKSSANSVTLPVNATIVPSMNQLILQDTVTQGDLLYQEPLVFDDAPQSTGRNFFTQTLQDPDESIEIPRNRFADDLDELPRDDGVEIELDFDLDKEDNHDKNDQVQHSGTWVDDFEMGNWDFGDENNGETLGPDESIEIGRAVDEGNLSEVMNESTQGIELGFDNFDQPLETIDDLDEPQESVILHVETEKQPRKKRATVLGKKIINDRKIELEVTVFSNTDAITNSPALPNQESSLENKRAYIDYILADTFLNPSFAERFLTLKPSKRPRLEPEVVSPEPQLPDLQSDSGDDDDDAQAIEPAFHDTGMGDMDFDFGDENNDGALNAEDNSVIIEERLEDEEDEAEIRHASEISQATVRVEKHITDLLHDDESTTLTKVLEKDIQSETALAARPKSEATRVFFELLVLATGDKVGLKQSELFGEISISAV